MNRLVVSAVVAGALGLIVPVTSAAAEPASDAVAPIVWGECAADELVGVPEAERSRFSCGNHAVPLDHERPALGTINIALMRRAAGDQDARVGALFLNPGGPGGSGYRMPVSGSDMFEPAVLDRFDLIGFDPRGVARSTPLRCFATQEDADEVNGRVHPLPVHPRDERTTIEAFQDYGRFCGRFAGPLLEHVSTKDVARDLDLLRAAVGEERMNYVGQSYGTLLGATYVNMFPARARAIILDGNTDPALRMRDGLEYDRQRALGFELTLDAFLQRCDQDADCAFGPDSRNKYTALREYLRDNEPIILPGGVEVDEGALVGTTAGQLYEPEVYGSFAEALQQVYQLAFGSAASRRVVTGTDAAALFSKPVILADISPDAPYAGHDTFYGVNCLDKPFTHRSNDVPRIADEWERQMPDFARVFAWNEPAVCPSWPVRDADAYRGPWNRRTDNPVLLFGNFYDPATRFEFSRRMASQLGNAQLVGVDAFGHLILGDSACTERIAADYLVDLRMPSAGTVCQPDLQPFPTPAGSATRN